MHFTPSSTTKSLSLTRTLLIALLVIFACSALVSGSVILLRQVRLEQTATDGLKDILIVSGLSAIKNMSHSDSMHLVEIEYLDISNLMVVERPEVDNYDFKMALSGITGFEEIDRKKDIAAVGSRPSIMPIYWIKSDSVKARLVLPIYGEGMWENIYGYIALENDFNHIAGIYFFQHGETPGIGDVITDQKWLSKWRGKRLFNSEQQFAIDIKRKSTSSNSLNEIHQIDGVTGATKTINSTLTIIEFWMGEDGYGPYLAKQRLDSAKTKNKGAN